MKKIILAGTVVLTILGSCKQTPKNGFSITGDLQGLKDQQLLLTYQRADGTPVMDTLHVTGGHFTFSDTVSGPLYGQVMTFDKSLGFPIFLEQGSIEVSGNLDSSDAFASGTPNNDALKELLTSEKPLMDQMKSFQASYSAAKMANDTVKLAAMEQQYESLGDQQDTLSKKFIESHPSALLSAMILKDMGPSLNPEELTRLYNGLDTSVQHSETGKSLGDMVAAFNKVATGQLAPDFTQDDVSGKPVSLSDFRGKYVLLDFWASWCGPCRRENPNVVKAFDEYKGKNFTILSVSLDQDKNAWQQAIKDDHLAWNHVSDLKYWDNAAAKLYGVQAIPANFLLDTSGRIIARNLRGDDLDKKLAEVLK